VTPDNRLQLEKGHLQIRVGEKLFPLSHKHGKLAEEGWMPIILIKAKDGPVRYDIELWATPLPIVKDWKKAFNWPTEGENFLNSIQVKATNTGDQQAVSTAKGHTCRFGPRKIRYIRVTQTHNSANAGRHLVEVMAYGE
jgi:hypothetical protein